MAMDDTPVRRQALDPARSFCVTAPAGSGKTELLVQRVLALLARVRTPEQVLAITFTRKAAAEMRERIAEALERAELGEPVESDHEAQTRVLAEAALAHARQSNWMLAPELLNIRTIDSLSGFLARQMPLESGLGAALATEDHTQPLFARAVQQLFTRIDEDSATGEALRALLRHLNNRWEQLADLLIALLGRRGDWGNKLHWVRDGGSGTELLNAVLENQIRFTLERAQLRLGADLKTVQALADAACERLAEAGVTAPRGPLELTPAPEHLDDWGQLAGLLLTQNLASPQFRKKVDKRQGFPPEAAADKADFTALLARFAEDTALLDTIDEIRRLPRPGDDGHGWSLVRHLAQLLPELAAHLLLVFQQAGRVDHTHIALAAEQALGDELAPSDLALRLDYQLEHILIDEFQDTSEQQFRLVEALTRGWAEHNASGAAPRTLFVVGDGMQSIYGFRDANVGLFVRARDQGIGGLSLTPLTLTHNFRSQAGIVDWVNTVFAQLLPARDNPERGQITYTPATATRPHLDGTAVACHVFDKAVPDAEAAFLLAEIQRLRADEPEASIAVLGRSRSVLGPLLDLFSRNGVPARGRDLECLSGSPAIGDLMALCRWLGNPADAIAGAALLRAPFCGIRLSDMVHLLGDDNGMAGDLLTRLEQRGPQLSADGAARARHLFAVLTWAEHRRDRLALPVWIEQVWLRLGGPAGLDDNALRDVERFIDLLREAEAGGHGLDPIWLADALERLYAEHDAGADSVELLTLHKSKGLQYDYVFIPGLGRGVRSSGRELLEWHLRTGPGTRGLLLAANDRQPDGAPTLYNYLRWINKGREDNERRRLLYVGITRAKRRVVLSGSSPRADGDWKLPDKTPLGMLCEVLTEAEVTWHDGAGAALEALETAQPALVRIAQLPQSLAPPESGRQQYSLAVPSLTERAVGTAYHRAMERLAQNGPLPTRCTDDLTGNLRWQLRGLGLHGDTLHRAVNRVVALVEATLADADGRWILADTHHTPACELDLLVQQDQEQRQLIVDRTFIDRDTGARWIVDYKTSAPAPGEPEDRFLEREADRYRDQLAAYARALASWQAAPRVICALYFPAIPRLHIVAEADPASGTGRPGDG